MRSKYIFLILACVYAGISLGGMLSFFAISESVLLGLSVSSVLISLADGVSNYCRIKALENEYDFALFVTSEYLQRKIDEGFLAMGYIDVCNLKYEIDTLKSNPKPTHPAEYGKRKLIKYGQLIANAFFIVGIASFILIPFSQILAIGNMSKYVTIIAFSFMCGNLFMGDRITELQQNKYHFDSGKQILISSLFPDFMNEYIYRTQHPFQVEEVQRKNEELQKAQMINMDEIKRDGDN